MLASNKSQKYLNRAINTALMQLLQNNAKRMFWRLESFVYFLFRDPSNEIVLIKTFGPTSAILRTVSHDNFLKSIYSFRVMLWKLFLFPSDRVSEITLLEVTNQVAINRFKKLSLEETQVWGECFS